MVRFTNGREMLCVPAEFTVNNALGGMEASRVQVRISIRSCLGLMYSPGPVKGPPYPRLGSERAQIAGPDLR